VHTVVEKEEDQRYHGPDDPFEVKHPVLFWLKKNLFSSWLNSILTALVLWCVVKVFQKAVIPMFSMDWTVIRDNLKLTMTGSYPIEQLWRPWLCLSYISLFGGCSFGHGYRRLPRVMILILAFETLLLFVPFSSQSRIFLASDVALALLGFCLIRLLPPRFRGGIVVCAWLLLLPFALAVIGGITGPTGFLPRVSTNYWGGLLLSMIISLTSILFSFPIGLLLALGRRSELKLVKAICTALIEIVRGVPLITILFIGYLIIPLALPASLSPSVYIRAMIGIIAFHSAYIAEDFRGGLQGISRTQYEAAMSLNLSKSQTMLLVILPQVLKRMIPVLVSRFTGILKDTSLVSIIGLLDLIGISSAIASNPAYMTANFQVLLFMALIYFVLCYSISSASTKLEKTLGINTKQAAKL
jgi:general L-amino acid transport system permease protein